jgi:hypothetical protein
MEAHETTTPVRAFDRAYINGQFTPRGTQVVDLVIQRRAASYRGKRLVRPFTSHYAEHARATLFQLHDSLERRGHH